MLPSDVEYLIHIFNEQKYELLESDKYSWVIQETEFHIENFSLQNNFEKIVRESNKRRREISIRQNKFNCTKSIA